MIQSSKRTSNKILKVAFACALAILFLFAGPWAPKGFAARYAPIDRSSYAHDQIDLDVPCFDQYAAGLPNGCEAAALTNVLNYYGFGLDESYLADNWIPRSDSDWVSSYLGNPHDDSGNSIAAPGLTDAANAFLKANDSPLRAKELTGTPLADLLHYVDEGAPVIIYATIDMRPMGRIYLGDESTYFAPVNSHTVVIKGYDLARGEVYLSDSISGYTTWGIDWLSSIYIQRGSQALVIR